MMIFFNFAYKNARSFGYLCKVCMDLVRGKASAPWLIDMIGMCPNPRYQYDCYFKISFGESRSLFTSVKSCFGLVEELIEGLG